MIYLLLSIILSVVAVSFFKLFERFGVNTFQAIIINYVTCITVGNSLSIKPIITQAFWLEDWFPFAAILGFVFISVFYSIGIVSQKLGVSVSMVAAKLSVVIPVTIAFIFHGDAVSVGKISGIILSLLAVYLISKKDEEQVYFTNKLLWLLPVYVFVGSGIIDSTLKFMQKQFIPPSNAGDMLCTIFLIALTIGVIVLLIKREKFESKSILWGIGLGIPNYFCMYFLVKTLENFDASFIFPINNIGIVVCSTLVSLSFFNEKLSAKNWMGFILALVSIAIISFV
jgi:drug/metabolite transporter (DMT)-like permease